MAFFKKFELGIFFIIFASVLWITQANYKTDERITADEIRYIKYAVSMHKHDVFGLFDGRKTDKKPEFGRANVPLYPSLIAGAMAVDPDFADSMICHVENRENEQCKKPFKIFYIAQLMLALAVLFFTFLIARNLSQNRIVPWLAALLIVGSGVLAEFSSIFMTEIMALPLFCGVLYFCLRFYETKHLRWVILLGISLGLMTLVRPSYMYLFYGFILFFTGYTVFRFSKTSLFSLLALILLFTVVIAPWSLRNKKHFDSYALTHSEYGEIILTERTNYNQMSWPEVGVAMIYWLPDFGDSLAEKIFPEHLHNKLGWHDKSYYGQGVHKRITQMTEELGSRDKIVSHLVKTEVLTPKHIATTFPLAMRGLYVSKYWGLVGLIAFVLLLIQTIRKKDYRLLIISLPVLYMVDFHAGLSVSIPRYNLVLITLYGISMAWYLEKYGHKFFTKIRSS